MVRSQTSPVPSITPKLRSDDAMLKASSFPYEVHVLHVHSHQVQGELIVARSEAALLTVYKDVVARKMDSQVRKHLIGRIVDLPAAYVVKIAESIEAEALDSYKIDIHYACKMHHEIFGEMPPGFVQCSCSLKEFEYDNGHEPCDGLGVIVPGGVAYLFAQHGASSWRHLVPPAGEDKEGLLLAKVGGHQSGANLEPLDAIGDFHPYGQFGRHDRTLFAFAGEEASIPAGIKEYDRELLRLQKENTKKTRQRMDDDDNKRRIKDYLGMVSKIGLPAETLSSYKERLVKNPELAHGRRKDEKATLAC